jgi:tetratricopeptide (TPR) repeat protein
MAKRPANSGSGLGVQRAASGQTWIFVHPPCVRDCADDLDEVRTMIEVGEADVAMDELLWLLEVCRDMLEAHYLLGKLAVEHLQDAPRARGHFGYAFQLGEKALSRANNPTPLSPLHPANRPFFDAGRGLAWCLAELGMPDKAREVVERLRACDPSDPLNLAAWIDELGTGGMPIVELG